MRIKLLMIGKTNAAYLDEGINIYTKRLIHYTEFTMEVVPDIKAGNSLDREKLKEQESMAFLKRISPRDFVILLDENGKQYGSEGFAGQLAKWVQAGDKQLVFVIGGAYGFGDTLLKRASVKLSLSEMTFSHQMVRLIFLEQLYRAFTIMKGEPYHHK